jgi:hypothetical protein
MPNDNNYDYLYRHISWDGKSLDGPISLPNDLTFRGMMTSAFSPGKPIRRSSIGHLVDREDSTLFEELLNRAIVTASASAGFQAAITEKIKSAPDFLRKDRPVSPEQQLNFTRPWAWAARYLIFKSLIANPDFQEYVLEYNTLKPWYLRIYDWGERLRLPDHTPPPPPASRAIGTGSVWEGLFRPILTSLVYVVPIAAGASFVGSYIIDRQAEVHIAPPDVHVAPAEVHVAPAEVHVAPAEVHVAPTEVNIAPTISVLPPDTTGLQKQVTELSNNINLVNTQVIEIRKLLPELPSSTGIQTIQLTRDENFWPNFSHFDKTFTVLLGNERGDGTPALSTKSSNSLADSNTTMVTTAPPLSSTDNGSESVSNGLQFDLNVRQEPYPTEMISPAHKIGDRRPALIEIGQIQKSVLPPSGSLGNNPLSGNQASFFLCDWRIPARFLISKDSPKQCAPETQDGSKPPYYVFTTTSQYVSELDAYVSLDEASRKRFLFLGSRRIVLQIVPNVRPVVSAPSKPPQKTPGASSAAR